MVDAYSKMAAVAPSLPEFALPLTPFELTAPVLGLLLVFRTNTAYERFNVGSDASWVMRLGAATRQTRERGSRANTAYERFSVGSDASWAPF